MKKLATVYSQTLNCEFEIYGIYNEKEELIWYKVYRDDVVYCKLNPKNSLEYIKQWLSR